MYSISVHCIAHISFLSLISITFSKKISYFHKVKFRYCDLPLYGLTPYSFYARLVVIMVKSYTFV